MKSLLGLLLLCSACALGQRRVDVDKENVTLQSGAFFQAVNGVPVITNLYYRVVEGSAFFNSEWTRGNVALDEIKEYKNLWLKLDLLANELHFKDDKGEEKICSSPISKIILTDASGRQSTFRHSSFIAEMASFRPESWLQEWARGRASLYTQHKKSISETRPYGSATLEQRIMTVEVNYLVVNGQYTKVKKLADLVAVLSDKKAELQEWLKKNEIDGKNPADLGRVVNAYNSFFPES
jgi:hypothetical protein